MYRLCDFAFIRNNVTERQESSVTVGSDCSYEDEATVSGNINKETSSSSHVEDQDWSFSIAVSLSCIEHETVFVSH